MKMLSLRELGNKKNLCSYCPLPEEVRDVRCYGNQPVMCESSHCKEAYDSYADETLAEENTLLQCVHGAEGCTEVLTYFWVPADWLCVYLQPE